MDVQHVKRMFRDLDELNACLHERELLGGPLHVVTDDGNLTDIAVVGCARDLDFSVRSSVDEWGVVVRLVSLEMLRILSLLTEPQRLMWFLSRSLEEIGYNPVGLACHLEDGVVEHREDGGRWSDVVTKCGVVEWRGLQVMREEWESRRKP